MLGMKPSGQLPYLCGILDRGRSLDELVRF